MLTRKDAAVIDEAGYLTDEEKKKAAERLGLLTGETMLSNLKSSMQQIMMNAYPTSRSRDLALLAQIGIATDLRRPGSGIDKTRLRGYLEVDEAKLEAAIASWPDAIRELFGNDTDGDLVVNAGVAYSLDALLRPYVQTGGILPNRVAGTDTLIARSTREISDYEKRLDGQGGRAEAQVRPDGGRAQRDGEELADAQELHHGTTGSDSNLRTGRMRLTINGEEVRFSLENERTLGEVATAVERWLADAGFVVVALSADGEDLAGSPRERWQARPVDGVGELDVGARHAGELRLEHWRAAAGVLDTLARALDDDGGAGPTRRRAARRRPARPSPRCVAARRVPTPRRPRPGSSARSRAPRPRPCARGPRTAAPRPRRSRASSPAALAVVARQAADPAAAVAAAAEPVARLLPGLAEVAVQLQTGRDREAMATVTGLCDAVQRLLPLVSFLPRDGERERLIVDLNATLRDLRGRVRGEGHRADRRPGGVRGGAPAGAAPAAPGEAPVIILQAGFRFINPGEARKRTGSGSSSSSAASRSSSSSARSSAAPRAAAPPRRCSATAGTSSVGRRSPWASPPRRSDTLERLVAATKIRQPFLVFSSPGLLDDVLRRGLYSIEANRDGAPRRSARRARRSSSASSRPSSATPGAAPCCGPRTS